MITSEISLKDLGRESFDGSITLHGNGNGTRTGTGTKWKVQYAVEMFTLVQDRDRDQDLLFSYCASLIPCTSPSPMLCDCTLSIKKTAAECVVSCKFVFLGTTDCLTKCLYSLLNWNS